MREARGWSVEELADRAQTSPELVTATEGGAHNPSEYLAHHLTRTLAGVQELRD
jgi:ribosome-binding protein aMBF1 (putative translation factor)